jgi:hypothetical protein
MKRQDRGELSLIAAFRAARKERRKAQPTGQSGPWAIRRSAHPESVPLAGYPKLSALAQTGPLTAYSGRRRLVRDGIFQGASGKPAGWQELVTRDGISRRWLLGEV